MFKVLRSHFNKVRTLYTCGWHGGKWRIWFSSIFGDILEDFWRFFEEFWRYWFVVRRLRTSINLRPTEKMRFWGQYGLQTASEVKSKIRFEIHGPNYICYRVTAGDRHGPPAGWSYIFWKKYYTFTIVQTSLYHLSIRPWPLTLLEGCQKQKKVGKFRRVYFFGWCDRNGKFRRAKSVT